MGRRTARSLRTLRLPGVQRKGAWGQPPKLLEYNADTPTSLLEAAVIQWHWLEEGYGAGSTTRCNADQFNSIHERLIAKWKDIASYLNVPVYFSGTDEPEDMLTLAYLQDTAQQAGLSTQAIAMLDIGWNPDRGAFTDLDDNRIDSIFKLYPWESMMAEQFAPNALATYRDMRWIEPIWKMLLSNKGILPILWELYPEPSENLLAAYFDTDPDSAASPHGLRRATCAEAAPLPGRREHHPGAATTPDHRHHPGTRTTAGGILQALGARNRIFARRNQGAAVSRAGLVDDRPGVRRNGIRESTRTDHRWALSSFCPALLSDSANRHN